MDVIIEKRTWVGYDEEVLSFQCPMCTFVERPNLNGEFVKDIAGSHMHTAHALKNTLNLVIVDVDERDKKPEDSYFTDLTYEKIAERATHDADFADGLKAGAIVCRAHDSEGPHPCPPSMLGVYLERLADGELP